MIGNFGGSFRIGSGGGGSVANIISTPITLIVGSAEFPELQDALSYLDAYRLSAMVIIELPAGASVQSAKATTDHLDKSLIVIKGPGDILAETTTRAASMTVSGSTRAYSITIPVVSSAGFEVGSHAIVSGGDGPVLGSRFDLASVCGAWLVTATTADTITISSTISSGTFYGNMIAGLHVVRASSHITANNGFLEVVGQGQLNVQNVFIQGPTSATLAHGFGAVKRGSILFGDGDDSNKQATVGAYGFETGLWINDGYMCGCVCASGQTYACLTAYELGETMIRICGTGSAGHAIRGAASSTIRAFGAIGGCVAWQISTDLTSECCAEYISIGLSASTECARCDSDSYIAVSSAYTYSGSYSPGANTEGNYNSYLRRT